MWSIELTVLRYCSVLTSIAIQHIRLCWEIREIILNHSIFLTPPQTLPISQQELTWHKELVIVLSKYHKRKISDLRNPLLLKFLHFDLLIMLVLLHLQNEFRSWQITQEDGEVTHRVWCWQSGSMAGRACGRSINTSTVGSHVYRYNRTFLTFISLVNRLETKTFDTVISLPLIIPELCSHSHFSNFH